MAKKDSKTTPAAAAASIVQPISDLTGALNTTYKAYVRNLTPRLQLIDNFLAFLVLLGVLQFVYVVLIGNFPFNAFLGGFISCVGQFVLTVSLRLQYVNQSAAAAAAAAAADKDEQVVDVDIDTADADETAVAAASGAGASIFERISPERALGDYIFASLILHFTVIHFIN